LCLDRNKTIGFKRLKWCPGAESNHRHRDFQYEAPTRTFEALAARYMTEHARRYKRTAEADQRNLNVHVLPNWRKRPFDGIGRKDVIALCEGIVAKGSPIQANRVQALLSKIFSFAVDAELMTDTPMIKAPQALTLTTEPQSNVERYDALRKVREARHAS
jgi:hypothetical protein